MKNLTRHTGKIEITKRLPSSANGNPRFEFTIDGYRAKTTPDSSHGYEIQNYDGRYASVTIGRHYGALSLNTLNSLETFTTDGDEITTCSKCGTRSELLEETSETEQLHRCEPCNFHFVMEFEDGDYAYTTEEEIRAAFASYAENCGLTYHDHLGHNEQHCDTRSAFSMWLDGIARDGQISTDLANEATL